MKRIILSLILTASLFFMSCSIVNNPSTKDTVYKLATLTIVLDSLNLQYDKVKYLLEHKQRDSKVFTEKEWDKLLDVDSAITVLSLKYQAIIKLDPSNMSIHDVILMWQVTKDSYAKAREIVASRLDSFDASSQVMFKSFDEAAIVASKQIDALLEDPTNDNLKSSLVLLVDVLSLAVKVLSIVAVI